MLSRKLSVKQKDVNDDNYDCESNTSSYIDNYIENDIFQKIYENLRISSRNYDSISYDSSDIECYINTTLNSLLGLPFEVHNNVNDRLKVIKQDSFRSHNTETCNNPCEDDVFIDEADSRFSSVLSFYLKDAVYAAIRAERKNYFQVGNHSDPDSISVYSSDLNEIVNTAILNSIKYIHNETVSLSRQSEDDTQDVNKIPTEHHLYEKIDTESNQKEESIRSESTNDDQMSEYIDSIIKSAQNEVKIEALKLKLEDQAKKEFAEAINLDLRQNPSKRIQVNMKDRKRYNASIVKSVVPSKKDSSVQTIKEPKDASSARFTDSYVRKLLLCLNRDESNSHVQNFFDPIVKKTYMNEIKLLNRRTQSSNVYHKNRSTYYYRPNYLSIETKHLLKSSNKELISDNLNCETLKSNDTVLVRQNQINMDNLLTKGKQYKPFGTILKPPKLFLGYQRLTRNEQIDLVNRLSKSTRSSSFKN